VWLLKHQSVLFWPSTPLNASVLNEQGKGDQGMRVTLQLAMCCSPAGALKGTCATSTFCCINHSSSSSSSNSKAGQAEAEGVVLTVVCLSVAGGLAHARLCVGRGVKQTVAVGVQFVQSTEGHRACPTSAHVLLASAQGSRMSIGSSSAAASASAAVAACTLESLLHCP
jgi:hypothetical protein